MGYVGLPLAVEISKTNSCIRSFKKLNRKVIGFDISKKRISDLKKGFEYTNEVLDADKVNFQKIKFSSDENDLKMQIYFLLLSQLLLIIQKNLI